MHWRCCFSAGPLKPLRPFTQTRPRLSLTTPCWHRYGGSLSPLSLSVGVSLSVSLSVFVFRLSSVSLITSYCLPQVIATAVGTRDHSIIMEIGGGTGASALSVLSHLPPTSPSTYLFTDLSRTLLAQAEKRFASAPEMRAGAAATVVYDQFDLGTFPFLCVSMLSLLLFS